MNKVYTAIQWRRDIREIWERFQDPGEIKRDIAWYGDPRYTPNPGGVLLKAENGTMSNDRTDHPKSTEEIGQN